MLIVSGCTVEAILYLILYEPDLPSLEEILLPLQSQIRLSAQPSDCFTWKLFFYYLLSYFNFFLHINIEREQTYIHELA